MQLNCLFCFELTGKLCLPTEIKKLKSRSDIKKRESEVYKIIYHLKETETYNIKGDAWLIDKEGLSLIEVSGLTMTSSENLKEKFKTKGFKAQPLYI